MVEQEWHTKRSVGPPRAGAHLSLKATPSPEDQPCRGTNAYMYPPISLGFKNTETRSSLVVQWVKDPALLLLWLMFHPWPGNFSMCHGRSQQVNAE